MEFFTFDNGNYENYKNGCEILKVLNIHFYKHSRYTQILIFENEYNLLLDCLDGDFSDDEIDKIYDRFLSNPYDLKDNELASLFFYIFE